MVRNYNYSLWIQRTLFTISKLVFTISGHIARDSHTSKYTTEGARSLSFEKNKKIVDLIKYELGGKTMTEFVAWGAKLYAYKQLDEEKPEEKQYKRIKKVRKKVTFYDYNKCLGDMSECRHRADVVSEPKP